MSRPADPSLNARRNARHRANASPRADASRTAARVTAAALLTAAGLAGMADVPVLGQQAQRVVVQPVAPGQGFRQLGEQPDSPDAAGKDHDEFVFVRDSAIAQEKFKLAEKMERLKEWGKSAELYQEVLEKYRDRVIPSKPDAQGANTRYKSVTSGVLDNLSKWPQEGLDVYRGRYEAKAAELVASAKGDNLAPLYDALGRFFVTESAKQAGLRLIDAALEHGEYPAAARIGDQLLSDYPKDNLVVERPALLFRTALAYALSGDADGKKRAADRAATLAKEFPKEMGVVRGKDVTLADALKAELAAASADQTAAGGAAAASAAAGDSWPTFGGSPGRGAVSAAKANPGTRLYALPLAKPPVGRPGQPGSRQQQQAAFEEASRAGQTTGIMPVADRGELYFQDGARVYASSLESGVPLPGWLTTYPETGGQYALRDVAGSTRSAQQTLTVTDRYVLAVMGQPDRQVNAMMFGQAPTPTTGEARLVCLDRATGKEQWVVQLSTASDVPKNEDEKSIRGLALGGAPLVVGDTVLVAGKSGRANQGEDCYVLSFDLAAGKFRWACFVASSGVPMNPNGYPMPQVGSDSVSHLAYADGRVYCLTNLGAAAALDAYSGTIAWLSIYPVEMPPANVRGMAPVFAPQQAAARLKPWQQSPAVLAEGKLFVLPAEGKNLLVYDAATGKEFKRISLDKIGRWTATLAVKEPDRPNALVGVVGPKVILSGAAGIGAYDWVKYDDDGFVDGAENPQVYWYNRGVGTLAGRPFLTGSTVYAAYDDRVVRIDLATGGRVDGSLYPPNDQPWQDGEGPGNLTVVGDHVVVAGASSVDVYTELGLATAKLDKDVAAAPGEAEPRLRYAEVMFAAGRGDSALGRLGEAVALMGGGDKLSAAQQRDRLFNDALTFATRSSAADLKAGVEPSAASKARVAKFFDLAGSAAGTPQQFVQYRVARARDAETVLKDPAAAVALYQEILAKPEARAVTLSDEQASTPALADDVAEKAIAALIRSAGPVVYEPFEKAAQAALATAGEEPDAAAKAAKLQAVAETFPNATVAAPAMMAAADAFEAGAKPRAAVRVLRQAWFKYQAGSNRAAILEAIARNYLAVADRNRADMAGTAAARLAMAAQLPGDPKLLKDLKLPDGTVVAKAGDLVSAALEEVRRISSNEAGKLLPDFKVPPQPRVRPWVNAFAAPAMNKGGTAGGPNVPTLPGAVRLVLAARDFARPDRVVTWSPAGVSVFAAGKGLPTAPIVKSKAFATPAAPPAGNDWSAVAPRGVAWAGDNALVWGGSRVACVDPSGKTTWELDLLNLGQLDVIRGGDAPSGNVAQNDVQQQFMMNGRPINGPGGARLVVRNAAGRVVVQQQPLQQAVAAQGNNPGNPNPAQPVAPAAVGGQSAEQVAEVRPVGDRALIVSNTGRVASVDLASGQVNWQNRLAEQTPDRLVATEDFTVVKASDDVAVRLFALDTFSGRVIGSKAYGRQSTSFPVNLALSAEGTLVYTLPDRLCLKDLYKGWDEDEKVIVSGPPGGTTPPIYAGATQPGQLVIAEGRILAVADSINSMPGMQANDKYVRVHSLETGQPLALRYTADGSKREVDQILTSGSKDWNVTIRTVGAKLYVISPKTVFGYNLDKPAESWRGSLDLFDGNFTDDRNFRDTFVGTKHLVLLDQPTEVANAPAAAANNPAGGNNPFGRGGNPFGGGGNPFGGNPPNNNAAANAPGVDPGKGTGVYRLHMLRRLPAYSAPNGGESGVLDHTVTVTEPAGIAPQWQACDGGFFYATSDGKVKALMGAEK